METTDYCSYELSKALKWSMKEIEVEFNVEYLHDLENIFYMFYEKELIQD